MAVVQVVYVRFVVALDVMTPQGCVAVSPKGHKSGMRAVKIDVVCY